jgi:hypothetical protein
MICVFLLLFEHFSVFLVRVNYRLLQYSRLVLFPDILTARNGRNSLLLDLFTSFAGSHRFQLHRDA